MPIFPAPGGGLASLPGFPAYFVYVDPSGNDTTGDGTSGSPFRTLYHATAHVISVGGGTVFFNDETPVGGPIEGQGLWLCGPYHPAIPGFLNIGFSQMRFVGQGNESGQFVFETPGAARIVTNPGNEYDNYGRPGIWVVGSEQPIEFKYIKTRVASFDGLYAPVRLGWDWSRRPDFTLEDLAVTSAVRSAGSTTFTVDLTTATPWEIVAGSRATVDGVKYVTLTLTRPLTVAMSPWVPGSIIRVGTGDDSDFPNGDYTVTGQSDILNLQGETQITVTYQQNGDVTSKALVGTVVSHGCRASDFITTAFANAEFPSCSQMSVTSATIDTITVLDPYGYSPRSASASGDPLGTIVKQIRGRMVSSSVTIDKCSFFGKGAGSSDQFAASPTIDLGGTSANDLRIYRSYVGGGNTLNITDQPSYDPLRTQMSILADPGGGTVSGSSFQAYDCQSQSGHVVWNPEFTEGHIYIDQWLSDSGGNALPTVVCGLGTAFASIYLHRIANADADVPAITIGYGYDRLKVQIGDVFSSNPVPVVNHSPILGPRNMRSAFWTDQSTTPSPWEAGWNTTWIGGLSTPHVGSNRAMGPVQARFENLIPALADWNPYGPFPTGITVTQDGVGPDGSTSAFKVVADNTYLAASPVIIGNYPETMPGAEGDFVAFGAWIKFDVAASLSCGTYSPGDISFSGLGLDNSNALSLTRRIRADVWQWVTLAATIGVSANGHYFVSLNIPAGVGTYYIFAPTLVHVPASVGPADFWEFAGTLKHQPIYLPPGMSGTMEDTKFVAHGGLGTAKHYVSGVAAGQITVGSPNGKYVELFDQAGNSLGVFGPGNAFTINP